MASSPGKNPDGRQATLDETTDSGAHVHAGEGGFVDFDEYIEIQLGKTSSTIKSTDVMTALVGAGTLVTVYLLFFIVFDQWIVPGGFGTASRVLFLSALLIAVVAWVGWKVVWPWRRRVNGLYSASTIEKATPGFKGSLLNLVDLLRAGREVPPEVYRSLERRAAVALTHVDVRETVDRRLLLRLSMALFAVVVIFCGYWIFSPKNPASSLWRALAPASEEAVATRSKIDSVRPGDVDVVARSQVDVTAEVRGELPAQAVLYYTTADRKFVDERIEARPTTEGSREFHFVINGDNGAGVLQDMTYRIVAGDDSTRDYTIHVIQPPAATIDSIRLDYPEYTRLTSTTQTTGAIDALEGTRVTLRATANMPLRSASLQFFDDESASKRAEEVPVHVESGNKLQATWTLQMRSDGTYPHFYRILCTSAGGESERSPSLYTLAIRVDQPPEIVLRDPKADLELPANAVLPLLIEARDPDFGLTYINLKIEKDGSPLIGPEIFDAHDRQERQFKGTYKWSLKEFRFRPKETITYWLEAQDNRKPLANSTNSSPRLRIHITDPVPDNQVENALAMAEKRQQEEEKRTEEDKNVQPKSDEDAAPDAAKPQPPPMRPPHPPKGPQKPGLGAQAAPQQPSNDDTQPPDKSQPKNERSEGAGDGQNGSGDKGKKNSDGAQNDKGGDGKNGSGKSDKAKAENGQQDESQKLDPDNPASDPQALQTIHDHMQKDSAKDKSNPASKGNGDDQSADKKPDQNGTGSPQDDKNSKDKGNNQSDAKSQTGAKPESGTGEDGKGQNQDGQNSNDKSAGTKNPEAKNPDGKNAEGKNPDAKNSDGKNGDRPNPDGKNSEGKNPDKSANQGESGNKPDMNPPRPSDGRNQPGASDQNGSDKNNPDKAGDKGQNANPKQQGGQKPQDSAGDHRAGDKSNPGKQPNSQPGRERQTGEKPTAEKQAADKPSDDKSGNGKRDQKPDQASEGKQPGDKQSGDKPSAEKQSGDKQSGGDQSGQKPTDGKSADQGQKPSDQNKPGDQSQSKESRGNDEKGQPSPGDQSSSDNKKSGRSSDSQSQQDSSQPQKPDTPPQSSRQKGSSQSGQESKPQPDSQRAGSQDKASKDKSDSANPQPRGQSQQSKEPGRKDATKPTDASDRNADRSSSSQPDAGNKPRPGQPQDDSQKANPRETPNGEKPDDKSSKNRSARSREPEETPKGVDEPTDKLHAKSTRDEQQPNKRGDEQSDVGKTGETKRSNDKNSPLSQEGTDKPGAKEKTSDPQRAPKSGDAQSSQDRRSDEQRSGQEGRPAKSGEQGQPGQPKQDQQGQSGQQGQQGQQAQQGDSKKSGSGQNSPNGSPDKSGSPTQGAPGQGDSHGNTNNGGGHNNGHGSGPGEGLANTEKDANLDYAKHATDLVLNRLAGQLSRGKVDQKLLDELGWTKDELRRFVERMRRAAQSEQGGNSPADEARRLQFNETIKSLDLRRGPERRSGQGVQKVQGLEMDSQRSAPPAEYRELYDAFTRSLSQPTAPRESKK
jgi:collagen type III alpha